MTGFAYEGGFGARLRPEGGARFRLWAPGRSEVALEVEGHAPLPMRAVGDGWFEADEACGPGSRYRYRVAPDLAVADPASRAQPAGVHGPSVVVDPRAYVWKTPGWKGRPWEETVVYEAHVGALGGFEGVAERLPALKAVGVTAVELMPLAEFSGGRNWGYDGVLPYAPESAYGPPEALKALVDRAHELGLMIFLDVVYNHFGPDGNYLGSYAPAFFREDVQTPWGAAIDFRRRQVRDFFTENALYWLLEYRVDGLRLDAVHAISEQDWLPEMAAAVRQRVEPGRHVHLILENERNGAALLAGPFDAQWNDDFHNVMHVLLTDEHHGYYADFSDRPAERLARCLAQGFIYQGEPSPNHGGEPRGEPSDALQPSAFVSFLQNHDQVGNRAMGERLTALCDPARLRAATALLLLSPQIPLLFMGEEIGSRSPFLFFTDFEDELADAVRSGRRKEFAKFPEFAHPAARERIPDPNALATFERSKPDAATDGEDWRAFYARLLELRRERIVPGLSGARALGASAIGEKAVEARWRLGDGAVLTIAMNLGKRTAPLTSAPASAPMFETGGEADLAGAPPASFTAWLETTP